MNLPKLNTLLPKKALLITAGILIALSFFTSFYFRVPPSIENEEQRLEGYIHRLQKDYNDFIADSVMLRKLVQRTESLQEFQKTAKKDYGIFLFAETLSGDKDLIFWNNQKSLPPTADYSAPDGEYFEYLANGYYLVVKKTIRLHGMTNNVVAYAMIPIYYDYGSMSSRHLKSHFVYSADATRKITIVDRKTPYPVNALSTKTLFHIGPKVYAPIVKQDVITATMRVLAFVLLLAYIHFIAESITRKRGALKGVAFLILTLVAVRLAIYALSGPLALTQFELFQPDVYASNIFNRSLGHLLINAIFFCWIVVFTWYHMGSMKRMPAFLQGRRIQAAGVAAMVVLILFTFAYANVVRSLVADSTISFDVINFFSLNWQTVIGFIVLALLSLSYYYFTRILFRFIFPAFEGRTILIYFGIALAGLLYLTLRSGNSIVLFHIPVLFWLLVYTLLLSQEQFIINRFKMTVAGMLFWIFIFSVSLAAVILRENKAKELKSMREIAETQADITEPSGERALSIGLIYLDNDFLLNNFRRFQNPVQNRLLRDSVIRENSTGLANKYETNVFVFDMLNQPVNNDEPLSYAELNHIYTFQSKPTGVTGLYYHETSLDQYAYIAKREIRDTALVGSFFIVSTPKTFSQDALSSELFRSEQETDIERSFTYSHAIYKYDPDERRHILRSSSAKYPFQIDLTAREIPNEEYRHVTKDGYDEMWYKASNAKVVVVAK
ncbi:MAG TPA: hypothetical protein VGE66_17830, partial [Chitinophagaceae bacterium]